MSVNPEIDGNVALRAAPNGAGAPVQEPVAAVQPAIAVQPATVETPPYPLPAFAAALAVEAPAYVLPAYAPAAQPWEARPAFEAAPAPPTRARRRLGWLVPTAIGLVGLIASGTLGYFLYATMGQRDVARYQLATTQGTLAETQKQLAARKATAAYVSVYIADSAAVNTEFANLDACNSYSQCRTAAQTLSAALVQFQADRTNATVPDALRNSDEMLGNALSAAMAADRELITGMDTSNRGKISDGWDKLAAAMVSLAKAEAALGYGLK